jgi:hypothetical protein
VLKGGEHLVPEAALEALAQQNAPHSERDPRAVRAIGADASLFPAWTRVKGTHASSFLFFSGAG